MNLGSCVHLIIEPLQDYAWIYDIAFAPNSMCCSLVLCFKFVIVVVISWTGAPFGILWIHSSDVSVTSLPPVTHLPSVSYPRLLVVDRVITKSCSVVMSVLRSIYNFCEQCEVRVWWSIHIAKHDILASIASSTNNDGNCRIYCPWSKGWYYRSCLLTFRTFF